MAFSIGMNLAVQPSVTVGISFRNPGRYLELAIKSVFAQTTPNWELLLFDDGSSDDSLAFTRSLNDQRIKVSSDGKFRGLNVRLNQMVAAASCPYFARMDADDIMHPDRIRLQLQVLAQSDPKTVVGSSAYSIDAESKVVGLKPSSTRQRTGFAAAHSFHHPTVLASTEWFRMNPYTEEIFFHRCQDAELWCRTSPSTRFVNLTQPLLFYREVGTFSFPNYLSTAVGKVILARRYGSKSPISAAWSLTGELAKVWLYGVADSTGRADVLVRRRNRPVPSVEAAEAQAVVDSILRQALPL